MDSIGKAPQPSPWDKNRRTCRGLSAFKIGGGSTETTTIKRTVGPNGKTSAKKYVDFKSNVKLTDPTYTCNNLTNFEFITRTYAITGNGFLRVTMKDL